MSQSHSAMFSHIVFSTKNRTPWLDDKLFREQTHAYLGGVSKSLDCPPVLVGGVEDHVHLLGLMGRNITLSNWIKELKRVSSIWIKEHNSELSDFSWQGGYAAFSISCNHLDAVKAYIETQEEHHQRVTFKSELIRLLKKYKVEYDERYLWD